MGRRYKARPIRSRKELVAREVDAAKNVLRTVQSSYDVVVVAPGVDVDKLMPDAYKEEESLEPQRDDDICSTTSTIDYDFEYTDEEYPSETEDEKMEESEQSFQ
ncbi:hypothetical protein C5167_043298 [Papaver somniferum]|uniref:Uncharacterized protein n=1 Tax=Papaver somniferum TaxID=3469 RepID=A0A4Y7L985_PAPSO|nr:hypothetical protein C5167_043298 [Papaver somniferum]